MQAAAALGGGLAAKGRLLRELLAESRAYGYLLGAGGAGARLGVGPSAAFRGGSSGCAHPTVRPAPCYLTQRNAPCGCCPSPWCSGRGRRAGPLCPGRRGAHAGAGGGGARVCGLGAGERRQQHSRGFRAAPCGLSPPRLARRWRPHALPPTPRPPPPPSWRRLWSCSCLRGGRARRCASSTSGCQTRWRRRPPKQAKVRVGGARLGSTLL
jgi:hypothetical protein